MKHILLVLAGATLYLSLSGFQCASSQMNTAELALRNKDYAKASVALEEEVALRPDNGKAWYMLGAARYELGEVRGMKDAFTEAREHADSETGKLKPMELMDIDLKTYNAWAQLYDSAFNAVYKGEAYSQGLALLERAEYVQAGVPAVIEMRSNVLLRQDKRPEANRLYHEYVDLVREDIRRGVDAGLSLDMQRKDVVSLLGNPSVPYNPRGYRYADVFPSGLAVYYAAKKDKVEPEVQGWKYYSDPAQPPFLNYWVSSDPLYNAAINDYANAKFDEALELLQLVERFDPTLEEVGSLIGQIYINSGRTDEAKALLIEKIEAEPDNPKLRITYGVLLHDLKEYEQAVDVLTEALKINMDKSGKDYQDILYNLGAFYKNWGVQLETSAADNGPATGTARAAYEEKYREALNYFSQLRTVRGGEEYELLGEIGTLHALLGNEKGLKEVVREFETLKNNDVMKNDGAFWRTLSALYQYVGESEKSADAKARAASLGAGS